MGWRALGGLGARTGPPQLSRRRRGEPCRGHHRVGAQEGTRLVWGPQKPAGTLGDKDLRDTTALKLLLTQTFPQEGVVTSGPSDVDSRVAPGKGTVLSVSPQAAPASPPGRCWGDSGPDTLELKAGSLGWGVRGGAASPCGPRLCSIRAFTSTGSSRVLSPDQGRGCSEGRECEGHLGRSGKGVWMEENGVALLILL